MARTGTNKDKTRGITRGSGNVFADLGFPDAEERRAKLRLACVLNEIMKAERLTPAAARGPARPK